MADNTRIAVSRILGLVLPGPKNLLGQSHGSPRAVQLDLKHKMEKRQYILFRTGSRYVSFEEIWVIRVFQCLKNTKNINAFTLASNNVRKVYFWNISFYYLFQIKAEILFRSPRTYFIIVHVFSREHGIKDFNSNEGNFGMMKNTFSCIVYP